MKYLISFLLFSTVVFSQNYQYALARTRKLPASPTGLTVSQITQTSADLTWVASVNVSVSYYEIYNKNIFLAKSAGTGTAYKVTGLTPETAYSFTVRAIDKTSNVSGDSNTQTFTTTANNKNGYTLDKLSSTSAGVYDANNKLLRTLWSGVKKEAGTYDISTIAWDGLNDDGADVRSQAAYYKVVSNNISEIWEGVIGNSSADLNGTSIWRGQAYPSEGLVVNNKMFLAFGSNEQSGTVTSTSLTDYQRKAEVMYSPRIYPSYTHLAYDGTTIYFAGKWQWEQDGTKSGYSSATLSNLWEFSKWNTFSGQTLSIYGSAFPIADIYTNALKPSVTGLAVQTANNNLIIARGKVNSLRIVTKQTGVLRQEYTSFVNPKLCKIDGNGFLWFAHGNKGAEIVEKFSIDNTNGTITATGITIKGFTNIRAITTSPDNTTIAIADAGTYHQVKGFSTADGSLSWTLGRAESYSTDATVYNDKFMFTNYEDEEDRLSFLTYESDGSLWVNDGGNERMLKFNTSRGYVDNVIWKSNFYDVKVDATDPTRVFSHFLEYKIDYSKNIQPGNANGAWTLVKNWGAANILESQKISFKNLEKIKHVETFSNGRTYALVLDLVKNYDVLRFVELVKGGTFRDTGITINDSFNRSTLKSGGRITRGNILNGDWVFYETLITGFNSANNPILGVEKEVGRLATTNKPFADFPFNFGEKTADGTMILFRREKDGAGNYHLAGYKEGSNDRTFRTLKGVAYEDTSAYPLGKNSYDVRNSVGNLGSAPVAMDNWFIWGYYGEFWRNTQTNYWHMLTQDGLFLYDFGANGTQKGVDWHDTIAGMAGNAFSPQLVKVNGQVYLYHNDESWHGGIHRWKINNLDSVKEFKLLLK